MRPIAIKFYFRDYGGCFLLSNTPRSNLMRRCEKLLGTVVGRIVATAAAFFIAASSYGLGLKERALRRAEAKQAERSIADGRQVFENRCAGCHGIDGRGGERAPDIATTAKTQPRSDSALAQIISNGIPAAGMPSFSAMDASTSRALIRYLRFLQGKTGSAALPGNPQNVKAI